MHMICTKNIMYTYYHYDYPLHPEIAYGTDLRISLIVSVVPVAISLREGAINETNLCI